ncbi:MAG: hypothetical protein HQK49_14430 [Oligoflexia bacterium]|nr:hypothetical protein [Oligoflexia bacterium]
MKSIKVFFYIFLAPIIFIPTITTTFASEDEIKIKQNLKKFKPDFSPKIEVSCNDSNDNIDKGFEEFKEELPKQPILPKKITDFSLENPECKGLLKSYKEMCGEDDAKIMKDFLQSITYVSYKKLEECMNKSISIFKESIKDRPFLLVLDKGKSSEWLYKNFHSSFPQNCKVISVNTENKYSNHTDEIKNAISSYKLQGIKISDIVRIDDAAYSGLQMSGFAKNAISAFNNGNVRKFSYFGKFSKFNPIEKTNDSDPIFHAIIPFVTETAEDLIKSKGTDSSIKIHRSMENECNIMHSLPQHPQLKNKYFNKMSPTNDTKKLLTMIGATLRKKSGHIDDLDSFMKVQSNKSNSSNLFLNLHKKSLSNPSEDFVNTLSTLFTEYKVPDELSVPKIFRHNHVTCSNGKKLTYDGKLSTESELNKQDIWPFEFNCIPQIRPPYKNKDDYQNLKYICDNLKNKEFVFSKFSGRKQPSEEECKQFEETRKKFVSDK